MYTPEQIKKGIFSLNVCLIVDAVLLFSICSILIIKDYNIIPGWAFTIYMFLMAFLGLILGLRYHFEEVEKWNDNNFASCEYKEIKKQMGEK